MNIRMAARFYAALGDEARLRILRRLLARNACACICELAPLLGKDQSVVYRHVKQLEAAGLVETRKEGRYLRCCLADEAEVRGLLAARAAEHSPRMRATPGRSHNDVRVVLAPGTGSEAACGKTRRERP